MPEPERIAFDFVAQGQSGLPQAPQASVEVIEPGRSDVEPDDYEEMLKARIPLNNNPRKASYLTYRSAGFSVRESCMLAEISFATVLKWRREDPEFRSWEGERLDWLQQNLAHDLTQMEFMRNFRLALRRDFKLLYKANYNLGGMTDREYDLLKVIRKHYTPQDLLAIQKALEPDTDRLPPGGWRESLTVTVEGRQVDDESARRAAARDLLERFEANRRVAEGQPPALAAPEHSNGDKPLEGEVLN